LGGNGGCRGTYNTSSISTSYSPIIYYDFNVGANCNITTGTTYAIVVYCPSCVTNNDIEQLVSGTENPYPNGKYQDSTDANVTWTIERYGARDFYFYVWTNPTTNSCSCPASGNWTIINDDNCSLSTTCNLSAGSNFAIVKGSLTIFSSGVLVVPAGGKAIINKTATPSKLVIESGGKFILRKS
jgi:hypothetical protein